LLLSGDLGGVLAVLIDGFPNTTHISTPTVHSQLTSVHILVTS